tara:strand:+ start:2440 stop:3576 length:1137 start_codon:yes stop_codon:yes gene_type:complete
VTDFEDIRPFHDDEVAYELRKLVNDDGFVDFLASWLTPRLSRYAPSIVRYLLKLYLGRLIRPIKDIDAFQSLIARFANKLIREGTDDVKYEGFEKLEPNKSYLFISNHRDIACDSMFLDYGLYINGFDTVRIAIGDNLVQTDFATSLMRLNKGFFIKRSVRGNKKIYAALLQASRYIKESIQSGNSVWIAQSEGRSKDAIDITDPALIKMLGLAKGNAEFNSFMQSLNIVPLSISYEFDPCDVLKAKELTLIESGKEYRKPEGEDLISLAKGLYGKKGKVKFSIGDPLDQNFEDPSRISREIDRQILSNLELYPINYWALSKLSEEPYKQLRTQHSIDISKKDIRYLNERLQKCPEKFREQFLRIYANPILNREGLEI